MPTTEAHPIPIEAKSPIAPFQKSLQKYWQYYSDKGRNFHTKGMLKEASHYFLESVRVAQALIFDDIHRNPDGKYSGIEMLYIASHNLASCHNQQNDMAEGELVLRTCHREISELAINKKHSKALRLESLCVLERSLFSLASQLAFMNKPAQVHRLIDETGKVVDGLQQQLAISGI